MKQAIVDISSPLLYAILKRILNQLKPLFVAEEGALCEQLRAKGFHPALCTHPSILFGYKSEINYSSILGLSWKVAFIRKAVRVGLLKSEKGHAIIRKLGIPSYYGNGVDLWFLESHTPILPYTVPLPTDTPKRIVIYTALTGDYDHVQEILFKEEGIDYLLFTNNKTLKSKTWQVVYVESELDNVLLSREIKMLPHKYLGAKYDTSIYIDANAVIYGELSYLANYLNEHVSFAVSKHSERSTVRDEIDVIIQRIKTINPQQARLQYDQYVKAGFKDDHGLAECGLLIRSHKDQQLIPVMEVWWREFNKGIRRDQISLLPSISMMQFKKWTYMDGSIWHNQFCKITPHKK